MTFRGLCVLPAQRLPPVQTAISGWFRLPIRQRTGPLDDRPINVGKKTRHPTNPLTSVKNRDFHSFPEFHGP